MQAKLIVFVSAKARTCGQTIQCLRERPPKRGARRVSAQCGDFWRLQAAGEAAAELGGSGVKQGDEEATSTDRRV